MRILLFLCAIIVSFTTMKFFFAADIGSDTAVTRFNTQQFLQNGDRIAGFASLAAGFALFGRNVTGTFDCFFPVEGAVNFNFGTLILSEDLILHNVLTISNWGNIIGNFHNFELPSNNNCFPLLSPSAASCLVQFASSLTRPAQVNSVSFSYDSAYIASGVNNTAGNELFVDRIDNGSVLTAITSAAFTQNVLSVDWHPSKDWIAVGRLGAAGDELYTYTFNRVAGTLTLLSSLDIGGGGNDANSVAWHPDGDFLAIAKSGATAIRVYPVNTSTGVIVNTPVTDAPGATGKSVAWNSTGSFLAAGTTVAGAVNELRVYTFVKSPTSLTLNASFDVAQTVNSVEWNVAAGLTNIIAIGTLAGTNRLQVYSHNSGAGTLTLVTGDIPTVEVVSVAWSLSGACLAAGTRQNTSGEVQIFNFDGSTLSSADLEEINNDVLSVDYSPNGQLFGIGTNTVGGGALANVVGLYQLEQSLSPVNFVTLNNIFFNFNNNATFDSTTLVFTGSSVINGRGSIMSFTPTFTLQVGPNSTLLIENIVLEGISAGQLVVDSTSTVSFQDVQIVLDGDYTFSSGRFEILKDLTITGPGRSFIYASPGSSLIRSKDPQDSTFVSSNRRCQPGFEGRLIMDRGTTFQYASTTATNLIQLEGDRSEFILNSATLNISGVNLQLTKGRFLVDGRSSLLGSLALILGDGLSVANNVTLEIEPAANLEVGGKLIYRNI